jgi:hypothetical protein
MTRARDLAKGTFSGDLTVDTNTLVVDSVNNRVGVGTASPQRKLQSSAGADDNCILATSVAGNAYIGFADNATTSQTGLTVRMGSAGNAMVFQTGGTTERMRIDSSGRVTMPYQPAFHASCWGSNRANGVNGNVVYGNAITNIGGHYNASNGRFTAPIAGTYTFSATILNQYNGSAQLRFMKNGAVTSASVYFNAFDEEATALAILTLYAGDYVQANTTQIHYESEYGDFIGHLIG